MKPTDPQPVAVKFITGLSVANGDHVVNGIDFAHDGRLLVAVGSQTNAGIPGPLGYLPVSSCLSMSPSFCNLDPDSCGIPVPLGAWPAKGSVAAMF